MSIGFGMGIQTNKQNKQIFIENSYITIHENIKSIYENSSPILGLFKKTSLGNIHRRQEGRVEKTLKMLNKLSTH